MGFREKMAWVMVLSLLVFAAIYFVPMSYTLQAVGFLAPASAAVGTLAVIGLVVIATIGAIIAALSNVRDAESPLDEREASIVARSTSFGSVVLGVGTVGIVLAAHLTDSLGWMVPSLVGALTVSQVVTYGAQITMYRSG